MISNKDQTETNNIKREIIQEMELIKNILEKYNWPLYEADLTRNNLRSLHGTLKKSFNSRLMIPVRLRGQQKKEFAKMKNKQRGNW